MKVMDGPTSPMRHRRLPRCDLCDEVIGVYEPILVEGPDGDRVTSLAADPELDVRGLLCRHPSCADTMSGMRTTS